MQNTKRTVILAIAAATAVAALVLGIIFTFFLPGDAAGEGRVRSRFVLGEWEGQVAVFAGDDPYPMQVFDRYVTTLPPEQQTLLAAGIPVEDAEELSVLLEDYTS